MRLAWLYLRTRLIARAIVGLVAVAAATRLGVHLATDDEGFIALVLTAVPLAAAAIIGTSTRSPFGDLERAAGRALPTLRLGHLVGLVLLAMVGLGLTSAGWGIANGQWVILRNLAGFTGLALLTARALGGALAWVSPLAYGGLVLQVGPERRWAWSLHLASDWEAWVFALLLLVAGLGVIALAGAREEAGEVA